MSVAVLSVADQAQDERFIALALTLGRRGLGQTWPNPAVGAVVVRHDTAHPVVVGRGWTQPGGDTLPQQCVPGVGAPGHTCPVTIRQIDVGDAFVRSNVVFRNGKIYYPQTIALPTGGITNNSRFVAQWTVLNSDGTFSDGGRVEDATATRINGGKHYAYPSLSVNKNNDVLLGFSEFESDDYADAGYTFRTVGDPAGTSAVNAGSLRSVSMEQISRDTGVPAERIQHIAREFSARRPSLAIGGGLAGAQPDGAGEGQRQPAAVGQQVS